MDKKEIFISYRSTEEVYARWVKEFLEVNGISCWMAPECIPGGSNYAREIPTAISNCKIMVIILSSEAQNSIWVHKEVSAASKESKIVMPFLIENCRITDEFDTLISSYQRYEAYVNKSNTLSNMLNDICLLLGKEPIAEPIRLKSPEELAEDSEFEKHKPKPANDSSLLKHLCTPFKPVSPFKKVDASEYILHKMLKAATIALILCWFPVFQTCLIGWCTDLRLFPVCILSFWVSAPLCIGLWWVCYYICRKLRNLNFRSSTLAFIIGWIINALPTFLIQAVIVLFSLDLF